jgi:hypothetical protein
MTSPKRTARLAGAAYLVLFICGSFSIFARSGMVVPGDAPATAANILASEFLFRLQLVSELVMSIAWLMVAFLLYILLRTVDQYLALLFLVFTAIGVATICANMVFQAGVLLVLGETGFVEGLDPTYLQAQAGMYLALFSRGWTISGIFTGLWLFPLGQLVIKSRYVPRVFGIGLMIGCFGYLIPVVTVFLIPRLEQFNLAIMSVSGIAEISFGLWLLFKGASPPADVEPGARGVIPINN